MKIRKAFLTLFYSGLSPVAPGTVGTVVSLILGLILLQFISLSTLFMLSILISVIAVREINKYELETNSHDAKEIVIDELAGMWLTLSISGINESNMIFMSIIGFIFFRLFDIWKPSIIGRIDRNIDSGWGVMGDDILAGIAAGIATAGAYQLFLLI